VPTLLPATPMETGSEAETETGLATAVVRLWETLVGALRIAESRALNEPCAARNGAGPSGPGGSGATTRWCW
jgi:hypothetical protein